MVSLATLMADADRDTKDPKADAPLLRMVNVGVGTINNENNNVPLQPPNIGGTWY